ncbi:universal stress protein [Variovorax sp. SRS16]|uniref:universal stress protein n=1 Tax=Variovorax sp. SRS16 TaxID=282217 RepID=UPI003FCC70B5
MNSILAITDFSTQGEQALERAALVAVERRAQLRIMYFVEVPNLNLPDPFERLAQRARQLARRHGIIVDAVSRTGGTVDHVVEEGTCADLLVIDQRSRRNLKTFWQGTIVDQLMRRCRCPVLVVKREASRPYGHALVAVDFSTESKELVRYACAFVESELELFHSQTTLTETEEFRQHAQSWLSRLTEPFDTRKNRVTSVVGHGDPARQTAIQQEGIGADLVFVCKIKHSTLVHFLSGSFAQRLLSLATSDVLVMPHGHRASSRAEAKRRIGAEPKENRVSFPVVRRRAL